MMDPDIVFIYDPTVPEGTGHGRVIRSLLPLLMNYCTDAGISYQVYPIPFGEFRNYYLKSWYKRLTFLHHAKIIHAFDPGWSTLNTNFLTYYDICQLRHPQHAPKLLGDIIDWKIRIMALKRAKCIFSISEWSKRELIEYTNIDARKIHVVRLGIDHKKYYPVRERGEFFSPSRINILSVGSNQPRKNFILVAKTMEVLRERGIEARFVRFGPSNWAAQKEEMEEIKRKKNLDIVEPGVVSEEVLRRHYSSCDVFVWPCVYIESLATLEALACGAKVVVLDRVFNREFLGDTAIYVRNNDPVEFAEGIIESLKFEMGNKGIEHAKKYSWERVAAEYLKHYKEFIGIKK